MVPRRRRSDRIPLEATRLGSTTGRRVRTVRAPPFRASFPHMATGSSPTRDCLGSWQARTAAATFAKCREVVRSSRTLKLSNFRGSRSSPELTPGYATSPTLACSSCARGRTLHSSACRERKRQKPAPGVDLGTEYRATTLFCLHHKVWKHTVGTPTMDRSELVASEPEKRRSRPSAPAATTGGSRFFSRAAK